MKDIQSFGFTSGDGKPTPMDMISISVFLPAAVRAMGVQEFIHILQFMARVRELSTEENPSMLDMMADGQSDGKEIGFLYIGTHELHDALKDPRLIAFYKERREQAKELKAVQDKQRKREPGKN